MRLRSFVAAAALLTAGLAAHADVMYSFVGNPEEYVGTVFTIDSPDFLTNSTTPVSVTTASHLYVGGGSEPVQDFGQITAIAFGPIETVVYTAGGNSTGLGGPFPVGQDGVYTDPVQGTLTVTGGPAVPPVAATPEPSSFALLGTGLLGAVCVARKQFV